MRTSISLLVTLLCLSGLSSVGLYAQNRQVWTETFPTAAGAFAEAAQHIPSAYETKLLKTETVRQGLMVERYEIKWNEHNFYGKQLVVVETVNGQFRAAYPRILPVPGALKTKIDEASWRNKLENLLLADGHRYESHSYGIVPQELDFDRTDFLLAAIIETHVPGSHRHDRVYLDAATGKLVARHAVDCTFVPGTAETLNYGQQSIETTQDGPGETFRLFDATRGDGLETVGESGNDLLDDDNNWEYDDITLSMALDVHYGMAVTYDFLKDQFGRDGLDGEGVALKSTTGQQFANAFYGGPQDMSFGAGEVGTNLDLPLSAIDIVGHEIAHGLTSYMNGLIYNDESGGLNEAFSDIIGVTIEFDSNPIDGPSAWTLGEQASTTGYFIRNMANPNEKQMPDTYGGDFWFPGLEVHSGSSIANYWFYLIVEGDNGTNDVDYAFDVPALGYYKAIDIVYDAFNRLMPSSNYADCSIATILAATERFGACSPEVLAVEEAWRAVNVLAGVAGIGTSDLTRSCEENETITFTAEMPGEFIDWDFGDGTSSTNNPATHQYTADGSYTAAFRFIGCSGDTITTEASRAISIATETPEACSFIALDETFKEVNDCFGLLTDDGGEEEFYNNNINNVVRLVNTGAAAYRFTFQSFQLETGYDYLYFYEGEDNIPLYSFTGGTLPPSFEIAANDIRVVFSTDGSVVDAGFVVAFDCIEPTQAPVSNFEFGEVPACRSLRTYTSTSENYPSSYNWTIDGVMYGQEPDLTINWADLGAGSYQLSLQACNIFGCSTSTQTIVITDEIGECEETIFENGSSSIQGCGEGVLLDDGGRDGDYSDGIYSTVTMSNEIGGHYRLNFLELALETFFDYLYIYDNTDTDNPVLLQTYNGFYEPFVVEFPTPNLLIEFITDGSVTYAGFEIEYACIEPSSTSDLLTYIDWSVSPNPFSAQFYVTGLPIQTEWTLQLFSSDGRLVNSQLVTNASDQVAFSAESIPAGMYWLRAVSSEGTLPARRLVKH